MRRARIFLAPLALAVALVLPLGQARAIEPPHVVVFSEPAGYRHAGIAHMNEVIDQLAELTGSFTVEHVPSAAGFTPELYARADAILFLQVTGSPLPDAKQEAFLRFFECGGAFVGVHASADSGDWQGYTDLLGARFAAHPHFGSFRSYEDYGWEQFGDPDAGPRIDVDVPALTEMTLNVEDRAHPATAPWRDRDRFRHADEFYQYRTDPRTVAGLQVLLSLDAESDYWPLAGTAPNPRVTAGRVNPWLGYTDDEPVAWTKSFGTGRVFYTNLGHNPTTWDEPTFQDHLLGGLAWATEVRPDDGCIVS